MSMRKLLLLTTALGSTGALWITPEARSADMVPIFKAYQAEQPLPAVSAPNFKFSAFGGSAQAEGDQFVHYRDGLYGGEGSFSLPISTNWGLQADGVIGSWGGDRFYGGAGHFFWRDPNKALFGLYGSALVLDRGPWPFIGKGSGVTVAQVGPEFELYWKSVTLRGIAGWEGGDVPDGGFAKIDLAWYPVPDFMITVGYRNVFSESSLAVGAEYLLPQGVGPVRVSLYAEGRAGNDDNRAILGGLRVYFGPSRTLIDKHRRDDPYDWNKDNIFAAQKLANGFNAANEAAKCAQTSCLTVSDQRLKGDISCVGQLANGIGLYRYRYLWSDTEYVGVMAQELIQRIPEAVVKGTDGYLRVNYAMLGMLPMTWEEWLRRPGANVLRLAA